MQEPNRGMFCTFKASFQDLPRDQPPLCVVLLKHIALAFTAAFSFSVCLSPLAVERPLIWADISGSCSPVSDQQYFLKCSAISGHGDQPDTFVNNEPTKPSNVKALEQAACGARAGSFS